MSRAAAVIAFRRCVSCERPLTRQPGESPAQFARRRTCGAAACISEARRRAGRHHNRPNRRPA